MKIVLITKGRHESVDYAKVFILPNEKSAEELCSNVRTGKTKYWIDAQIVEVGKEIKLGQPQDEVTGVSQDDA